MLTIELSGDPIAWKRPAHVVRQGRCTIFDAQKNEKECIRWQMKSFYPSENLITCPVDIELLFYFTPPKQASKARRKEMLMNMTKHAIKPDIDNCAKFYLDCLVGCVLADDCIVCGLNAKKIFNEYSGVRINVKPHHVHGDITISNKEISDFLNDDLEF